MTDTRITPESVQAELDKPLDPDRIKGREGPGRSRLSYLSQDDVKRTANRIFGFGGWSYEPLALDLIGSETVEREVERTISGQKQKIKETGTRVAYKATVKVTVKPLAASYVDVGYGEDVSYTSALQPHELAVKEAVSDAVKRAMVPLGDQFGLSLYEKGPASGGRHTPAAGRQQHASQPPTLTEGDLRQIHAERNKFKVSEDDLKRLARFCCEMPSLTSMKEVPRSAKKAIVDAIGYLASNPADADAQMREFEANAGITSAITPPARDLESEAEAAGIPDGYG